MLAIIVPIIAIINGATHVSINCVLDIQVTSLFCITDNILPYKNNEYKEEEWDSIIQ